jgi:hypothetical protein
MRATFNMYNEAPSKIKIKWVYLPEKETTNEMNNYTNHCSPLSFFILLIVNQSDIGFESFYNIGIGIK